MLAELLPGDAESLAGDSTGHKVNCTALGPAVVGADVSMDREAGQDSIPLASSQDSLGECVVFDDPDNWMPEEEAGEDAAAVASAEMEGSHVISAFCVGRRIRRW